MFIFVFSCFFHTLQFPFTTFSEDFVSYNKHNKAFDDFHEGYKFIFDNTPRDSVVGAWWNLGYQISKFTQRVTFTDGFTFNSTQISLLGLMFLSNEESAWKLARSLGLNYILVTFGGASGFLFDDIMKFQYIPDIVESSFPNVTASQFFNFSSIFQIDDGMTESTKNSLYFRLCYYNFDRYFVSWRIPSGFDFARNVVVPNVEFNLMYFKEVFTSSNWITRIFEVTISYVWNI